MITKKNTNWNRGFLSSHALSTNLIPPKSELSKQATELRHVFQANSHHSIVFSLQLRGKAILVVKTLLIAGLQNTSTLVILLLFAPPRVIIAYGRLICFSTLALVHSSSSFGSSIKKSSLLKGCRRCNG